MNTRTIHYMLQATLLGWVACVCLFIYGGIPALWLQTNAFLNGKPPSALTHFVHSYSSALALVLGIFQVVIAICLWRKRMDPLAMLSIAVVFGFFVATLLMVVAVGLISPLMDFSYL